MTALDSCIVHLVSYHKLLPHSKVSSLWLATLSSRRWKSCQEEAECCWVWFGETGDFQGPGVGVFLWRRVGQVAVVMTSRPLRNLVSAWEFRRDRGKVCAWKFRRDRGKVCAWVFRRDRGKVPAWEFRRDRGKVPAWEFRRDRGKVPAWELRRDRGKVSAWVFRRNRGKVPAWVFRRDRG